MPANAGILNQNVVTNTPAVVFAGGALARAHHSHNDMFEEQVANGIY